MFTGPVRMRNILSLADENGARQSVVIPFDLFNKLVASSDLNELYEAFLYIQSPNDHEIIPHEVEGFQIKKA